MNFGVNLPGPFRVGVSSKGKVNVGANLGPLSVSTAIGAHSGERAVEVKGQLVTVVDQLRAEGWKVSRVEGQTAFASKGMTTLCLDQVRPGVVRATKATSRATLIAWLVIGVALFALCNYTFGD